MTNRRMGRLACYRTLPSHPYLQGSVTYLLSYFILSGYRPPLDNPRLDLRKVDRDEIPANPVSEAFHRIAQRSSVYAT